jgi:hypothetical protein
MPKEAGSRQEKQQIQLEEKSDVDKSVYTVQGLLFKSVLPMAGNHGQ